MNLLPCPFCGNPYPKFNVDGGTSPNGKHVWAVRCRVAACGARVKADNANKALKRWNTRPAPATSVPSVPSDKSDSPATL
jgi:hypothetical protein